MASFLRSFHAEFAERGKATLALRVCVWGCVADAADAEAAAQSGDRPDTNAFAAAAAPKPACILEGEFTAMRTTHARAPR